MADTGLHKAACACGRLAAAVGCFEGFELPRPQVAVFTEHIQDWAAFDDAIPSHPGARPLPPD